MGKILKFKRCLVMVLSFLFIASTPIIVQAQGVLSGKKIIVDAGHGGYDSGAVSRDTGILEKDANMSLAIKVASYLRGMGAEVVYTRQPGNDVFISLDDRANTANTIGANLFVSIHHNGSVDATAKGVSTHYSSYRPVLETNDVYVDYNGGRYPYIKEETTPSGSIIYFQYGDNVISMPIGDVNVVDLTPSEPAVRSGDVSQKILDSLVGLGFINRKSNDHNYFVTRKVKIPSVLVEAGFMSNRDEVLLVTSPTMEDKIASSIAESVKQYFIANGEAAPEPEIIFSRQAGIDRYKTNIEVSKAGWTSSDVAVLASGEKFPDALSAAPLAKKYNAPIILTEIDDLRQDIESEIDRLKAKTIYIVGGEGAVSARVENKLKAKGINCIRLAGIDRYDTSVEVAKHIGVQNGVFIANGQAFPDALSIASYAAFKGMPIILTDINTLSESAKNLIRNSSAKSYVIGGSGAVSNQILSNIPNAERIAGIDRYETNTQVMNRFSSEFKIEKTYISSGEVFADALSGSALAALSQSPIVLTSSLVKDVSQYTKNYVNLNKDSMLEKCVIGGTGVVSDEVVKILFR